MKTDDVTVEDIAASVLVVPPLARHADLSLNRRENKRLIRHIEAGGVTTLLYGGNANFYHVPLSEYAETLTFLQETVEKTTWLIPSAGPDYGRLIDQAAILRDMAFPTVMVLPQRALATPQGAATAVRRFVERLQRPVILYLKSDSYLSVESIGSLMEDGLLCAIKYAVVRQEPGRDRYLRHLLERMDRRRVVSGIGEGPAFIHLHEFGLASYTSGSGAIAPRATMLLLRALQNQALDEAREIQAAFRPLEDYRDDLHAIRVLHDAVTLAGIADMGPILPHLHNLEPEYRTDVKAAADRLLAYNNALLAPSGSALSSGAPKK